MFLFFLLVLSLSSVFISANEAAVPHDETATQGQLFTDEDDALFEQVGELPVPDEVAPSCVRAVATSYGISCAYALLEHPVRTCCVTVVAGLCLYTLFSLRYGC